MSRNSLVFFEHEEKQLPESESLSLRETQISPHASVSRQHVHTALNRALLISTVGSVIKTACVNPSASNTQLAILTQMMPALVLMQNLRKNKQSSKTDLLNTTVLVGMHTMVNIAAIQEKSTPFVEMPAPTSSFISSAGERQRSISLSVDFLRDELKNFKEAIGIRKRLFSNTLKNFEQFVNALGQQDRHLTEEEMFRLIKFLRDSKISKEPQRPYHQTLLTNVVKRLPFFNWFENNNPKVWAACGILNDVDLLSAENFHDIIKSAKYAIQVAEAFVDLKGMRGGIVNFDLLNDINKAMVCQCPEYAGDIASAIRTHRIALPQTRAVICEHIHMIHKICLALDILAAAGIRDFPNVEATFCNYVQFGNEFFGKLSELHYARRLDLVSFNQVVGQLKNKQMTAFCMGMQRNNESSPVFKYFGDVDKKPYDDLSDLNVLPMIKDFMM